eukprot:scaffold87721_cov46-Attheya_sp.AAC.1
MKESKYGFTKTCDDDIMSFPKWHSREIVKKCEEILLRAGMPQQGSKIPMADRMANWIMHVYQSVSPK